LPASQRSRPLLFVDVDGVLNPYGPDSPPGFVDHELFPSAKPIRVSASHGEWLHELSIPYELVWGSWWNDSGKALLATVLDLPRFHGAVRVPSDLSDPDWKVPGVAELAGTRPLAWLDDMFTPDAWTWAERRPQPTLLIPVDPDLGLDRDHVDRLLEWAFVLGREPGTTFTAPS
jgi:hypothetical protein